MYEIIGFQNNLSFSLYVVLFTYYLVIISESEIEFERESSNRRKCVASTLEFSINSRGNYN